MNSWMKGCASQASLKMLVTTWFKWSIGCADHHGQQCTTSCGSCKQSSSSRITSDSMGSTRPESDLSKIRERCQRRCSYCRSRDLRLEHRLQSSEGGQERYRNWISSSRWGFNPSFRGCKFRWNSFSCWIEEWFGNLQLVICLRCRSDRQVYSAYYAMVRWLLSLGGKVARSRESENCRRELLEGHWLGRTDYKRRVYWLQFFSGWRISLSAWRIKRSTWQIAEGLFDLDSFPC